jgi:hypothetical protein
MDDEILEIFPIPLPFSVNEKIFHLCDEDGNKIGEPFSYNDWLDKFKGISGVNEELVGRKDEKVSKLSKDE